MNVIQRFDGTEYRFLSNFYPAPIQYVGVQWKTSEHAYQATKTLNYADWTKIYLAPTPGAAKRAGRQAEIRKDWDLIKVDRMREIVRAKFAQHFDLAQKLLDTGDSALVEGNDWGDEFWGMTRNVNGQWKGQNWLGRILMEVRAQLRREQ